MLSKSIRWGLVTFALGITTGVLGHFIPSPVVILAVIGISVLFSFIGMAGVDAD